MEAITFSYSSKDIGGYGGNYIAKACGASILIHGQIFLEVSICITEMSPGHCYPLVAPNLATLSCIQGDHFWTAIIVQVIGQGS